MDVRTTPAHSPPSSLAAPYKIPPGDPSEHYDSSFSYHNMEAFTRTIKSLEPGVYHISEVPLTAFDTLVSREEERTPKFRIAYYSSSTSCMIITVPGPPHEYLHRRIVREVFRQVGEDEGLSDIGASMYRRTDTGGVTTAGEGDSALIPTSWALEGGYPTLIIEVGWTQSWASIRAKARFWFHISQGEVKIVLLVKATRSTGTVELEKWKLHTAAPADRISARTRSRQQVLFPRKPACLQQAKIKRHPMVSENDPLALNADSYDVVSDDIILEFHDMFLRPPRTGQADVVLGREFYKKLASGVWNFARLST
ncbi:hypothetical protein ACRALDRAFT_2052178 [Sodiomyces alcalophilus JCM 7366]|uniref:uncharacterized protein n=1 Tax=Sodiomyces alcalophilus JCM 7366 TaxID=591952 RepID=UPI0039B6BBDA